MPRQLSSGSRRHPFAVATAPAPAKEFVHFATDTMSPRGVRQKPTKDSRRAQGVLSVVLDAQDRNSWWWEAGTNSPPVSADGQTTTFSTKLTAQALIERTEQPSPWVSERSSLDSTDSNATERKLPPLATWPWERNETPIAAVRIFNQTIPQSLDERAAAVEAKAGIAPTPETPPPPTRPVGDTYPPHWGQRFVNQADDQDSHRHQHQTPRSDRSTIVSVQFQDSQPSASATDVSFYPRSTPSPSSFDHRTHTATPSESHNTHIEYPYGTRQYGSPEGVSEVLAGLRGGEETEGIHKSAAGSPRDDDGKITKRDDSVGKAKHQRYRKSLILATNTFYLPPPVFDTGQKRESIGSLGNTTPDASPSATLTPASPLPSPLASARPSPLASPLPLPRRDPSHAAGSHRSRNLGFRRCCGNAKAFDDPPSKIYREPHSQSSLTYASNASSSCFSPLSRKHSESDFATIKRGENKMTTAMEIEAALQEHQWRADVLSQAVAQSFGMGSPAQPPRAVISKKDGHTKLSRSSSGYIPIASADAAVKVERARSGTLEGRKRQVSFQADTPATPLVPPPPLPISRRNTASSQATQKAVDSEKGPTPVPFPVSNGRYTDSPKAIFTGLPPPALRSDPMEEIALDDRPRQRLSQASMINRASRRSAASTVRTTRVSPSFAEAVELDETPGSDKVLKWRSTIMAEVESYTLL